MSDPDNDPIEVIYAIDGTVVAQGTSFVFESNRPGGFQLVARAIDSRGGTAEVERQVVVTGPSPRLGQTLPADSPAAVNSGLLDGLGVDLDELRGSALNDREARVRPPPQGASTPRGLSRSRRPARR